jgi:uncharacterized coiled-coil protein SlyX
MKADPGSPSLEELEAQIAAQEQLRGECLCALAELQETRRLLAVLMQSP